MSELSKYIFAAGEREGLSPLLIAAIIMQESEGELDAVRFEEKWFRVNLERKGRTELSGYVPPLGKNPSLYDEKLWRAHSWGVMQIMGETARVLGFRGRFIPSLIYPEASIMWGSRCLARCFERAKNHDTEEAKIRHRALLYYNGGGNPDYPHEVVDRLTSAEVELLVGD